MYIIIWDYLDRDGTCLKDNKMSFDDKDEANAFWKTLKDVSGCTNIRTKTNTQPEKKYIALSCVFRANSRRYTYLAKEKVEVGTLVVVWTKEGRELVTVVECAETTESELTKTLPMSKYQYIQGKVVAA